tara:strand:- start:135 stop:350 length:216 start_codon:yes stop_codon:yes gene_type:complete
MRYEQKAELQDSNKARIYEARMYEEKKKKEVICEYCEGRGYYNLSATYDDVHSRIECTYCLGGGQSEVSDE